MAFKRFFSLLAVILSLLLTTTNASSRTLPTSLKTTVLDVVSSLQQAQHILSVDPTRSPLAPGGPEYHSDDPIVPISSSPISLEIHSRDTLVASRYKDYKSLVLSRLERDSSRVAGIAARIRLAVEGLDRSDLKPVYNEETRYQPEDIVTAPLFSGGTVGIPEYFTRIGVGTPAREMFIFIDTGSDLTWIQSKPCSKCYPQSDPVFDPASSSTYKPLPCSDPRCTFLATAGCISNKCLYAYDYNDGSFTGGELATDTVTFGNSSKFDGIVLGCGHDNEGHFKLAAGLIGLGGGPLSMTSQINATSLSYCLVDHDSINSSILEFNSVDIGDGDVTVPLLRNPKVPTFYYVGLTGFSVGGQQVSIPPSLFELDDSGSGGVIMDCGTDLTHLHTQAYSSLRDAFINATRNLKRKTTNSTLFDTCYDFSSSSSVQVPTVTVHFTGGKSLDLPAKNCLVPLDNTGTFCLAFVPTSSPTSIFGNVQQGGTRITYDLKNNIIGFSANKC